MALGRDHRCRLFDISYFCYRGMADLAVLIIGRRDLVQEQACHAFDCLTISRAQLCQIQLMRGRNIVNQSCHRAMPKAPQQHMICWKIPRRPNHGNLAPGQDWRAKFETTDASIV
jgi:hypothetical protein